MQGMRFLLLGDDGRPMNHGIVAQKVTEERYLCTFMRNPQVSRLCHVDEISTWNLFPNDDQLNSFIAIIARQNPPAEPPKQPEPPAEPPGGKKAPAKKASKKKANATTKR
jgi:hypothetical protein